MEELPDHVRYVFTDDIAAPSPGMITTKAKRERYLRGATKSRIAKKSFTLSEYQNPSVAFKVSKSKDGYEMLCPNKSTFHLDKYRDLPNLEESVTQPSTSSASQRLLLEFKKPERKVFAEVKGKPGEDATILIRFSNAIYILQRLGWPSDHATAIIGTFRSRKRYFSLWTMWKQPSTDERFKRSMEVDSKSHMVAEIGRMASGLTGSSGPLSYDIAFLPEVPENIRGYTVLLLHWFESRTYHPHIPVCCLNHADHPIFGTVVADAFIDATGTF